MKRLKLFRWAAVLTLALALAPGGASAQEADTVSVSGTFGGTYGLWSLGMLGDDLAEVYANGHEHAWTLTLHGVSYSYDYFYDEWNDGSNYGYYEEYSTRVHATSFHFQFFGPDADILNAVVSQELVSGSLPNGAVVELSNLDYFQSAYPEESGPSAKFDLGLRPLDPAAGVSFDILGNWEYYWFGFFTDEDGYPLVVPQRVKASYSRIADLRPGNAGELAAYLDDVDIGSSEPPVPPPPPPTLTIADGSVREGNKGTSRLDLTVTLSRSVTDAVTVNYATVNGTALANSDYTATSGTLTFQPGHTNRTISIAIKGDRKREPNETFSVQLSSAVGATIADTVATGTILNDD